MLIIIFPSILSKHSHKQHINVSFPFPGCNIGVKQSIQNKRKSKKIKKVTFGDRAAIREVVKGFLED